MSALRDRITEICLPEWGRGWDEEVCKCKECLDRANKRANQILSLFAEWGIEPCQEHYRGGGVISRRECPLCWQSLLEEEK